MQESLINRLLASASYMEAIGCLTMLGSNRIFSSLYLQYFQYRMCTGLEVSEEILLDELKARVQMLSPFHAAPDNPMQCWLYNMMTGQLRKSRPTECAWLFDVFTFVAPDEDSALDYIHVLKLEAQV